MLNLLRNSSVRKELGRDLERQIIARARAPRFFTGLGVPDTMDGRFDLVVLHAWLVLVRLQEGPMLMSTLIMEPLIPLALSISVGSPVQLVFEDRDVTLTVPRFQLKVP